MIFIILIYNNKTDIIKIGKETEEIMFEYIFFGI